MSQINLISRASRVLSVSGAAVRTELSGTVLQPQGNHTSIRTMASEQKKALTMETINPHVKKLQYAVRGPLVAAELQKEIDKGAKKLLKRMTKANIGDAHAMGQKPITFIRQVVACVSDPTLLEYDLYPSDVKERAQGILAACAGQSVGAYTMSYGIELIRRHVAEYIERRDGHKANWQDICLSGGATGGIKSCLQLLCNHKVDGKDTVPGVYMIPCDCGSSYIGETRRNITTRLKGHIRSVSVLARETYLVPRKVREAIEISRRPNFNRDGGWALPPAWKPSLQSASAYNVARLECETVNAVCDTVFASPENRTQHLRSRRRTSLTRQRSRARRIVRVSSGRGRDGRETQVATVLIPIPRYPLYSASLAEYGLEQVGYYLHEGHKWAVDINELERAFTNGSKTHAVRAIVVINPGNPIGQVLTRSNIEDIIKFAQEHSLFVFADEVYQDNVYDKDSKFYSFKKVGRTLHTHNGEY
ncbi:hypothetical protein SFRURICE_015796 [Spodoptera frugiperda]|nr:hypothetical protein SFRURICE_015796 [Spodoptera frugiperda]